MPSYPFYIAGCDLLTGLSPRDWALLCELAEENNTSPSRFASQMIASELARYRDELRHAEEAA